MRSDTVSTADEVATFTQTAHEPGDIVEVRIIRKIDGKPEVRKLWHRADELVAQADRLQALNRDGWNIFAGVNPRRASGLSGDKSIDLARVVFADFDGNTAGEARATIEVARLPAPTLLLSSGHGAHAYWRLATPQKDMAAWEQFQKDIAALLGSDPVVFNAERIMRVPGFLNVKSDPVPCEIVEADPSRVYDFDALRAIVPTAKPATPKPSPTFTPDSHGDTARHWLGQALAKSSVGNRNATGLWLACQLRDEGMPEMEAEGTMRAYAARVPAGDDPYTDAEALASLQSAYKSSPRPPAESRSRTTSSYEPQMPESESEPPPPVEIISVTQLLAGFPELRPSVVRGLLREGESLNLIASAKSNKTYSALDLALCIVTGRLWLGRFQIESPGPVLYVDAELHPNTLAKRLRDVAAARGIVRDEYAALDIVSLRGHIRDLYKLGPSLFWKIQPRKYAAIFVDALYRFQPERFDENSNSDVTKLYNLIDTYAEAAGAAFVIVHHSSKGNQAGKSVVDVGSGASAMARAADGHLVLRPHKEDGVFVLEGAVRSWPPVDPFCLRWTYPIWTPAPDLDPEELRQPGPRRRQKEETPEPIEPTAPAWTTERFVGAFIGPKPTDKGTIIATANAAGMTKTMAGDLIRLALQNGSAHVWKLPKTTTIYLADIPQPIPEMITTP